MRFSNQKGMTLIELIVSIALLAIIIVPVLGLLSASNLNNANSRGKTSNGAVAQAVIEYYKKVDITSINSGTRPVTIYLFCNKGNLDNEYLPGSKTDSGNFLPYKTISGDDGFSAFTQMDSIASQISGAKPYDYGIRILLSNTDASNLVQVTVTAWDPYNKDKNKITFTSLRGTN